MAFNFDYELEQLNKARKELEENAKRIDKLFDGFLFETFLKQCKISEEEFDNFPEEKQELIRAEFEQRKWK